MGRSCLTKSARLSTRSNSSGDHPRSPSHGILGSNEDEFAAGLLSLKPLRLSLAALEEAVASTSWRIPENQHLLAGAANW